MPDDVRTAMVDSDMVPFTVETYDYATGELLDRTDVNGPGVMAVKGWKRPVVIAVTYWRPGDVHLVIPSGDILDPYQRVWTVGPPALQDDAGGVQWGRGWLWFEHP